MSTITIRVIDSPRGTIAASVETVYPLAAKHALAGDHPTVRRLTHALDTRHPPRALTARQWPTDQRRDLDARQAR